MRIAVVDDSAIDSQILIHFIHKYYETHAYNLNYEPCQIAVYEDHDSFFEAFLPDYFQLVFLDIYLTPELNGFEIAKRIRAGQKNPKVPIIFISSTRDYAVESYDVGALGYMVKPASLEQLTICLDRLHEHLNQRRANPETIEVISDRQHIHIPVQGILYIVANGNGSSIVTNHDTIHTSMTIEGLKDKLESQDFLLAKRGHLVNLAHVTDVTDTNFIMDDGSAVPLKVKGVCELTRKYKEYLLRKSVQ